MKETDHTALHRGIARRVTTESKPAAGDVLFSADYTVNSTDDKGGNVLTSVEVILCFWGTFWSATPAPTPARNDYEPPFAVFSRGHTWPNCANTAVLRRER